MPREHGALTESGHTRWCDGCGHEHGNLYPCPHYPPELLVQLAEEADAWYRQMHDAAYLRTQLDAGADPLGLLIAQIFSEGQGMPREPEA